MRERPDMTDEQRLEMRLLRFFQYVEFLPSGCWRWTGATVTDGYGSFHVGSGHRNQMAHRWLFVVVNGAPAECKELDHLCRVRNCVNPDHLEVVTTRINILRGEAPTALNARKTHCKRGHPLEGDNLYVPPGGKVRPWRGCRQCYREYHAQYYRRTRAAS